MKMSIRFCGGIRYGDSRWDAINISWPLVLLEFSTERLTVTCNFLPSEKKILFDRSRIDAFQKYNGWISTGIQILHSQPDIPRFVVLFIWNCDHRYKFMEKWLQHNKR